MPGFPECVNPFLASQPWGAEPPPLQWALGRQEGCCAGESGSSLFSVPPGSRDSLAQGALGFPWAEALGQIGSALGDRMLQRPPWPQGKLWRGRTAHLPDLEPCQRKPGHQSGLGCWPCLLRPGIPSSLAGSRPWSGLALSRACPHRDPIMPTPVIHLEDGAEAPSSEAHLWTGPCCRQGT